MWLKIKSDMSGVGVSHEVLLSPALPCNIVFVGFRRCEDLARI